jgi:hypothetical protein
MMIPIKSLPPTLLSLVKANKVVTNDVFASSIFPSDQIRWELSGWHKHNKGLRPKYEYLSGLFDRVECLFKLLDPLWRGHDKSLVTYVECEDPIQDRSFQLPLYYAREYLLGLCVTLLTHPLFEMEQKKPYGWNKTIPELTTYILDRCDGDIPSIVSFLGQDATKNRWSELGIHLADFWCSDIYQKLHDEIDSLRSISN